MASKEKNIEELKSIVVHTLETNGVLGQIRAQLRANVYKAIDKDEQQQEKTKNESRAKPNYLNRSPLAHLMAEIVAEFFEFFNLRHTMSVFVPESNLGHKRRSRIEVAQDVGLGRNLQDLSILEQLVGLTKRKGGDHCLSSACSTTASSRPSSGGPTKRKAAMRLPLAVDSSVTVASKADLDSTPRGYEQDEDELAVDAALVAKLLLHKEATTVDGSFCHGPELASGITDNVATTTSVGEIADIKAYIIHPQETDPPPHWGIKVSQACQRDSNQLSDEYELTPHGQYFDKFVKVFLPYATHIEDRTHVGASVWWRPYDDRNAGNQGAIQWHRVRRSRLVNHGVVFETASFGYFQLLGLSKPMGVTEAERKGIPALCAFIREVRYKKDFDGVLLVCLPAKYKYECNGMPFIKGMQTMGGWTPTKLDARLLISLYANNQAPCHDKACIIAPNLDSSHKGHFEFDILDLMVDIAKGPVRNIGGEGTGAAAAETVTSYIKRAVVVKVSGKAPFLIKILSCDGEDVVAPDMRTIAEPNIALGLKCLKERLKHLWEGVPNVKPTTDIKDYLRKLPETTFKPEPKINLGSDNSSLPTWAHVLSDALHCLLDPYDNYGFADVDADAAERGAALFRDPRQEIEVIEQAPSEYISWVFVHENHPHKSEEGSFNHRDVASKYLHILYANVHCPTSNAVAIFSITHQQLHLRYLKDRSEWERLKVTEQWKDSILMTCDIFREITLDIESNRFCRRLKIGNAIYACESSETVVNHIVSSIRTGMHVKAVKPMKLYQTCSIRWCWLIRFLVCWHLLVHSQRKKRSPDTSLQVKYESRNSGLG